MIALGFSRERLPDRGASLPPSGPPLIFSVVLLLGAEALLFGASLQLSEAFYPRSPGLRYFLTGAALVALAAFAVAVGVWSLRRRAWAGNESAVDRRPPRAAIFMGAAMLVIAGALLVILAGTVAIAINPDAIETNLSSEERIRTAVLVVAITAVPLAAGIWLLRGR